MKVNTCDLIGPALNWAVETLEIARWRAEGEHVKEWWVKHKQGNPSPYSTDWLFIGPIIEREKLDLEYDVATEDWRAIHPKHFFGPPWASARGDTPLIAAARAFVASKLGHEVDVPDELEGVWYESKNR